ncbi:activator of basal transcription 1 [Plakobranchus ocellatus]|uniref:Activator of basal transcription 1 n=1 Tax=Plakobranchus ocellatus TaxID=259542 RepID=A0AAV3XWW0_9GAST|nr:activator of basal transcription 1 [Plakobranchus ocellatus]
MESEKQSRLAAVNTSSEDEDDRDSKDHLAEKKPEKRSGKTRDKSGVIYLSSVPEFMSVQKLRNVFSDYGEVGRTFFQPVEKSFNYKKGLLFTEGWVEFKDYRAAKYVATVLNATQVGGKKRNPWYSCIWTIKYLPNFTWTDVNADRELKRATYDSRIRADIAQVKKQTNFYVSSYEKSRTLNEMKQRREKRGDKFETRTFGEGVPQRLTDEEIRAQKAKKRQSANNAEDKPKKQRKTFVGSDESTSRKFVMKSIFS